MWVFFLGSSEISSSNWWFSEVVGEINHVVTETEIEVGWVKVLKKLPYFASWEVKKCWKIMFCWKKFHVFGIYVQFCFPEVSSAGEFENFSMFRWLLLLLFFTCLVFCFFVFSFFFFFFFFVPRGKSSVSSLGCFCCCCFFFFF